MKKLISLFITILVISALCLSVNAGAESVIRRADFQFPNAKVEISGIFSTDDISAAKVGAVNMDITGAALYNEAESSDCAYLLIDVSGSMPQSYLDALKPSLKSYAASFGDNDKLVVITFGDKVKTIISGNESRNAVNKAIDSIRCNQSKTSFYQALDKAYTSILKKKDFERKYIMVISDGADYDKGSNSQQEIIDNYSLHEVPVYGLCPLTAEDDKADSFSYIARTSGGDFKLFDASSATKQFNSLYSQIKNVTIVTLESDNKKSLGESEFSINVSGKNIKSKVNAAAEFDNEKPVVNSISYSKKDNAFTIEFSEAVLYGDQTSSYKITDESGDEHVIIEAKYTDDSDSAVLIKMNDKVYSDTYTFEFSRICDNSDNQNALAEGVLKQEIKGSSIIIKYFVYSLYVIIPLAFLVAVYLILVMAKHKKKVTKIREIFEQQVEEEEKVKIVKVEQKKGLKVSFYIETENRALQKVDYNLISSIIVGRSDMCDLIIDDPKLSRQHFAIESVGNGLAITDLGTTNGTTINGIPVQSKTFIKSGDKILAGLSVITVQY